MSADTPSSIQHPRNFWVGAMFMCAGAAAILIGLDYDMGSARAMGPAYFPRLIDGLLALVWAAGATLMVLAPALRAKREEALVG